MSYSTLTHQTKKMGVCLLKGHKGKLEVVYLHLFCVVLRLQLFLDVINQLESQLPVGLWVLEPVPQNLWWVLGYGPFYIGPGFVSRWVPGEAVSQEALCSGVSHDMLNIEAALQVWSYHQQHPGQDRGCDVSLAGLVLSGMDNAFVIYS